MAFQKPDKSKVQLVAHKLSLMSSFIIDDFEKSFVVIFEIRDELQRNAITNSNEMKE